MAAPADWAARKFEFPFAADIYPAVLMRLRGTPARLREVLGDNLLNPERLAARSDEHRWSALERIGHLWVIERLWVKRIDEFLSGAEVLTAADMSNTPTKEQDFNRYAEGGWGTILAAFTQARQSTIEQLDALEPADFGRSALHPRLMVPMRLADHCYFIAEHDDHELAWIWELLRS